MYNIMGAKVRFTEEKRQMIVDMYNLSGYTASEIIKKCDLPLSRTSIYLFLREKNNPLVRKLGNKHNLVGKIFGYLTVTKMAQTVKSGKLHEWRAICNCSNCGKNDCDVSPQSLLRGTTTSCGCRRDQYLKITGKNSKQYTGYEGISGKYWGLIKSRAKNRNHKLEIDIKYGWNLYLQQNRKCALSGLLIEFGIANKKSSETTASLDRIDSKKGYVEGNVQWVHKHVNIMKNVYEQNYFISLCKLIYENKNV